MTDVNPVLVERYQLMLQSDPKAKIFAPLAEAYRKMGLIDEGIQICQKGVGFHPDFAGGRVALGRLYLEKGLLEEAETEFLRASELSPENLLAQSLLGDTQLKLRKPKEALKAYKMLLLLAPQDARAQKMVKKLESLTADEYEDDVFAMTKLHQFVDSRDELETEAPEQIRPLNSSSDEERRTRDLERYLSLADAFIVRNDFDRAEQSLLSAERLHGAHPEILRRLKLIRQRHLEDEPSPAAAVPPPRRQEVILEQKVALLKEFKKRIAANRRKT